MMRILHVFCGLGLVGLFTSPIAAQVAIANDSVVPGARVRFSIVDYQSTQSMAMRRMAVRGTVLAAPTDSLVILFAGASELRVPRSAIADLAVSRGTEVGWRAQRGRTARQTALTLAYAALLTRVVQTRRDNGSPAARSTMVSAFTVALTLQTVITAKNAFSRTERWEPVVP